MMVLGKYFNKIFRRLVKGNIVAGFTLIELLVVISIIAILTAVATVSYTNVQKKSRDGKRKSDLAAIQQALEVFYSDNGYYPTENNETGSAPYWADEMSCQKYNQSQTRVTWGTPFTCPTLGKTYMQKIPSDPVGGSFRYFYEPFEVDDGCQDWPIWKSCQHYTLWATLENKDDPDIDRTTGPTSDGICEEILGSSAITDGRATFYLPAERHLDNTNGSYYNNDLGEKYANYCVHDPKSS